MIEAAWCRFFCYISENVFACKTVWFVLLSVLPFSLFSASLNVRFSSLHLRAFVFERQIYFGGWIRKSSGLRPLCRKK